MAALKENDISSMIKYLHQGDDYDEAMKYFLGVADSPGLMEQSVAPSGILIQELYEVYNHARQEVNRALQLDDPDFIKTMRFYYVEEFNFVHGMFMSGGLFGATIFFPGLGKGAMSIVRLDDPQTHFVRITAFRKLGGEA